MHANIAATARPYTRRAIASPPGTVLARNSIITPLLTSRMPHPSCHRCTAPGTPALDPLSGYCTCTTSTLPNRSPSTLLELLARQPLLRGLPMAALLENLEERERAALARVVPRGEVRMPNWRHNLGQGASARMVGEGEARALPAWEMARRAAAVGADKR